jgi:hypothetical protein
VSDDELIAALDGRTLPAEAFTHAEHVHLAWACLRRLPLLDALAEFRRLLIGFATHHGKPCLYHETVTFAYLLLVYERMARAPEITEWSRFARDHSDLLSWRDGPFFEFYGTDVLTDRLARFCFVLPAPAGNR